MRRVMIGTLAVATLAAMPALADTVGVSVNGDCDFGSCPPVSLTVGGTNDESFSFDTTLADGDRFLIAGKFSTSNSGDGAFRAAVLTMPLLVEYLGNASGGPSKADQVTVDTLANFAISLNEPGSRGPATGTFGPGIATGSSTTISGTENGVTDVSFGTFTAPKPFNTGSASVTYTSVNGQLAFGGVFANSFAAGSQVGSYIDFNGYPTPAVPEPATTVLLLAGLAGLGAARRMTKV